MEFPVHQAPPNCVTATIDGAARGNPGPAAYGVVFQDAAGKRLTELAGRLGRATNNVAEYRALLVALTCARTEGWRAVRVRTDSELLAKQLLGDYKVKSLDLKPLHEEARRLVAALDYFAVEAVPRKLTRAADKLANAALDKRPLGLRPRGKPATDPRKPGRGASHLRVIRAVYEGGVLKPLEPLDLAEGEETLLILRPRKA